MFTEKQKVLADAPGALNKPDQPWEVTVEGGFIVARWKWMDATFFAPTEVSNAVKEYTFKVALDDKGKYKEIDKVEESSARGGFGRGKAGFGSSSSTFVGKTSRKSIEFGLGKNNQTGEVGLVGFKLDTSEVKKSIREYLASCGWKNDGMLGIGKSGFSFLNSRISRVVIRILYGILLFFGCSILVNFFQNMQFAAGDLKQFRDAAATVKESKMTGESMSEQRRRRPGSSTTTYIYYNAYSVKYAYTAEFDAWGKSFAFEYEGENKGETDRSAVSIPAAAYIFPKPGDTVRVIFNPEAEGSFRIGSKEEWQRRGEVSFANPSLFIPCILFAVALLLIVIDVKDAKKRRLAAAKP